MTRSYIEYRLKDAGYDESSSKIPSEAFLNRIFEDYSDLQKCLYKNIGALNALMDAISNAYETPASIVSASFESIAASESIKKYHALFDPNSFSQMTNAMIWDREFYDSQKSPGVMRYDNEWLKEGPVPMLYYNIIVEGEFFARFILIVEDEWRIPYLYSLVEEVGSELTEHFRNANSKNVDVLGSEIFKCAMDQIIQGIRPEDPLAFSSSGWQENDLYKVCSFRFNERYPMEAGKGYLVKQLRSTLGECFITEDGPLLICVCNISRSPRLKIEGHKVLVDFLSEYVGKVGISNEYSDIFRTPMFIKQSEWAIDIGSKKDPMFWYYYFSSYIFDYMLNRVTSEFPADQLVLPELRKLSERDSIKGSELLPTLKTYIQNKCNGQSTARELFIHRTTFLYRMQVIKDLTGLDPDDADTFKKLVIAFELMSRT